MSLLVFFSDHDMGASGHTGVAGNAPEERKRLVQKELGKRLPKSSFRLVKEPEAGLARLGAKVHDPALLGFLESAWGLWSKEWASAKTHDHLRGVFALQEPQTHFRLRGSEARAPPLIAGFAAPRHDPAGAQLAPESSVFAQACFFAMDKETPLHESTAPALRWDLGVIRESAAAVLAREARVVYAQITHPGHHAGPSSYGGFCFVNQAALAARLLQRDFARVAVVDVDYHAGNGTMSIFWNDASVFFASLHADPLHDYPFNAGFAGQAGPPAPHPAHGTTMNVPLPGGTTWPEYREKLLDVVRRAKVFGAQALVVSLGVDTLRGDPVAWPRARFELDPEHYAEMGRILLDGAAGGLELPTVVVQEGGYLLSAVPMAVANFLTGLPPAPPDVPDAAPGQAQGGKAKL